MDSVNHLLFAWAIASFWLGIPLVPNYHRFPSFGKMLFAFFFPVHWLWALLYRPKNLPVDKETWWFLGRTCFWMVLIIGVTNPAVWVHGICIWLFVNWVSGWKLWR